MKILDRTTLSGSIAKLVEFPKYYIKNGIKYDKIKGKIQSNSAYNFNIGHVITVQKMAFPKNMYGPNLYHYNPYRYNAVLEDMDKSKNIYYTLDGLSDRTNTQCFITEDKDENPNVRYGFFATGTYSNIDIVGQTDSTIIFLSNYYNSGDSSMNYSYGGIASLYKTSDGGSDTKNKSFSYSYRPQLISFDGSTLKIGYLSQYTFYVKYFNIKNPTTFEEIYEGSISMNGQSALYQIKFSDLDVETNKIYIPVVSGDANTKISIKSFDINTNTFNDHNIIDLNYDLYYINISNVFYHCEFYKMNNKKYIILGRTLSPVISPSYFESYKKYVKFYLFELKNNGDLELKDTFNKDDELPYNTMLFDDVLGAMIVSTGNVTDVIKINSESKFERVYRHNKSVNTFGLSMDKTLFLLNSDLSVDEVTVGNGQNLIIELENPKYIYNGTNIDTYFKTGITDLIGNYVDARVEFKIDGDATFGDGSVVKTIKLSKDGLLTVPIVIKGKSKVCINGKVIL